jgi:hypothetical protein
MLKQKTMQASLDKSTSTCEDLFEGMFTLIFTFYKDVVTKHKEICHDNYMILINRNKHDLCMFRKGTPPPYMNYTHISNIRLLYDVHSSLPSDLKEALEKKQIEAKYIPKKFKDTFIVIVLADLRGHYESRVYKFWKNISLS